MNPLRLDRLRTSAIFALALLVLGAMPSPVAGCMFSGPPPPFCGKTLVVSAAVPGSLLLPGGGGAFDLSVLVYFGLFDFPAGTGICPDGPYSVTVDVTATCAGGGDGGGMATETLVTGFNTLTVPITLTAGPPRLCDLTVRATTTLADGMVVDIESDTVVCVADPAPADPSLPRLDLQLLGPAGSELARVHPGDQSSHTYRVTNNDEADSFLGELQVEMVNTSRLPGASGPMPPGTGVFSISDPVEGDNFPIGFTDDLFEGCLLLPPDPTNPAIPTLVEPLDLAPGEFVDVDVFTRPWGMCADGSCGRAKLTVAGDFSDVTAGLACAGFVTAADVLVPPTYAWPDAGEVLEPQPPPSPDTTTVRGEPRPGDEKDIDLMTGPIDLVVDGLPVPIPEIPFSDLVNPTLGRTQVQLFDGGTTFEVDSFFDIAYEIELAPSQGETFDVELRQLDLIGSAPTGFEEISPSAMALVALGQAGSPFQVDSFFDVAYQIQVVGIDNQNERRPIRFQNREMTARTDGTGFRVRLGGGQVTAGTGNELLALELIQDFRGFASEVEQGSLGEIFTDGFESGNVSAWSTSTP